MEPENKQLAQYDEFAVRHNAALAAFRTIYEAKNPYPDEAPFEAESLFIPAALVLMIVASVLVSGSRTVLEFGGGFFGLSAFVMIEGAIITYSFFKTRRDFTEARLKTVHKRAGYGLLLALVVAVVANVRHTLVADGESTLSWINTAIQIAIGFSAPALAFISGDIMAVEVMANVYKKRKHKVERQKEIRKWDKAFLTAWNAEKGKWGVKIQVMKDPPRELEAQNPPVNPVNLIKDNGLTREKASPKLEKALQWLRENPGHESDPPRELEAQIIGVSYGTIFKAQKLIQIELDELNGHSQE